MASLRVTRQLLDVVQVFLDLPVGVATFGYEVVKRSGLKSGTVHPILMRIRDHGWLAEVREEGNPSSMGRPRRRYFTLTDVGRAEAAALLADGRARLNGETAEVRVLTQLGDVTAFEEDLAAFLDSCPHVLGGYTFSCWPVAD